MTATPVMRKELFQAEFVLKFYRLEHSLKHVLEYPRKHVLEYSRKHVRNTLGSTFAFAAPNERLKTKDRKP